MAKHLVDRAVVQGMTKKERQKYVRELRRRERERIALLKRRRRIIGWSATGAAAAVGITALITVTAVSAATAEATPTATALPAVVGPANMLSDGLLLQGSDDGASLVPVATDALTEDAEPVPNLSTASTSGVLDLQLYVDVTSEYAATLWQTVGETLTSAATAGGATLELHPYAVETADGDALAAVAAFGCVADIAPDQAFDVWQAMLQRTAEGEPVTASTAKSVVADAGVTDETVVTCISDAEFHQWAVDVSDRAAAGVPSATQAVDLTSGVAVTAAGSVYTGAVDDLDGFETFLDDAYAAAVAG